MGDRFQCLHDGHFMRAELMTEPAELWRIAPTELRPDEDPHTRFLAEVAKVSGTSARCTSAELVEEIVRQIGSSPRQQIALTADLGDARPVIGRALIDAGHDVYDYERIADDRQTVRHLDVTVTGCLAAVAATGSIVTGGSAGRGGALVAPTHICVVEARRVVAGLADLMRLAPRLGAGSMIALQSGPSRTADIEKTLIIGVHGPKRVHVIVLDGVVTTP